MLLYKVITGACGSGSSQFLLSFLSVSQKTRDRPFELRKLLFFRVMQLCASKAFTRLSFVDISKFLIDQDQIREDIEAWSLFYRRHTTDIEVSLRSLISDDTTCNHTMVFGKRKNFPQQPYCLLVTSGGCFLKPMPRTNTSRLSTLELCGLITLTMSNRCLSSWTNAGKSSP